MEGILAVGGFWLCIILAVMKKPIMAYIEKAKLQRNQDMSNVLARVEQLEQQVTTLGGNFSELKETAEFAQKLLIESSKKLADSHQLLIESSQRLALQQRQVSVQEQPKPQPQIANIKPTRKPPEPHSLLGYDANLGKVLNENTIRFERLLPAPADRVWQYLTNADRLASWLAVSNLEPRVGGRIELNFDLEELPDVITTGEDKILKVRGMISCFEPERMLAFSWMDVSRNLESHVTFELKPQGEQTSVVLTHTRLPKNNMHEFMAGWHARLDIFTARLKNALPPSFAKRFREVVQTYAMITASAVVISSSAPAQAAIQPLNEQAYQTLQLQRANLLSKYDAKWRDADDLQRQIETLKRENSHEAEQTVGRLDRALQDEYRDLHQLELDIRDVDQAMR
jgi:uncharacterized protein YndB with AHSA1/START domain/uncharacterized protein YqcC (DUF446 family)